MKLERDWFVVLNSHRMRILRELPEPGVAAGPEIVLQATHRNLRDVLHDRPTRSFASAGGGRRSAVEPSSDPIAEDERVFLNDVFKILRDEHEAGAFDGLYVFGSPEIMGYWRDQIPAELRPLVRGEVTKNFVRLPSHELIGAIRSALAV